MMWYPAGSRLLHLAARRILTSWAIYLYSSRTNTILVWIRSGKDGCLYSKLNGGGIMARHPLLRVLPLDEGAYCALLMPALSMTGSSQSLCRARGQRPLHVSHCQSYQSIGLLKHLHLGGLGRLRGATAQFPLHRVATFLGHLLPMAILHSPQQGLRRSRNPKFPGMGWHLTRLH